MHRELRKTRFVCVSDTHNANPANGAFKLPKGDVLIHAGDLTNQGSLSELQKTLDWIDKADFEVKIVIAGNHDITLHPEFYADYGLYFHNQAPQDPQACMKTVRACKSITFLNHESSEIRLVKEDGPRTTFKIFGSPYSPARGRWAFGYPRDPPEQASSLWDKIPLDTEVLVTHTPPKYHCDESRDHGAAGCEILRQTLWRVRPCLAICGHVHEGRGVERILWDLEDSNIKYKESNVQYWVDPGLDNKKQCLVNLTSKGAEPLDNSGSFDRMTPLANSAGVSKRSDTKYDLRWKRKPYGSSSSRSEIDVSNPLARERDSRLTPNTLIAQDADVPPGTQSTVTSEIEHMSSALRGQGGIPPSGRCDMEALSGRLARRETCVINAAMVRSSWPYTTDNIKRYNKPIVVDIDLPTWED